MATPPRKYKTKDVDMLITASTITESAIAIKAFLQSKRATWADPFFDDFKTTIEKTIQDYLGADNAKELRESTQALTAVQAQAITALADSKIQITQDFKANKIRRTEILNQLGFTNYLTASQKGDQEALINLLYQFKKNLTPSLKSEITTAGTAPVLLDTITDFADVLKNANVSQESFKGTRKTLTADAINAFNQIYDTAISICTISRKFLKDKPDMQDQFSFAKVTKTLSHSTKSSPKTPPITPP